jgi:TatD DNase family protein
MIDTHCHLDLYPDPSSVAEQANAGSFTVICVTNTPSAFERAYPHVRSFSNIRLAIGLHPLAVADSQGEWQRFQELVQKTSYVGEVGLDFSPAGAPTKSLQLSAFRFVLTSIRTLPRFVTIHSRGAESAVIELLEELANGPMVFHWYSGSVTNLDRALSLGHYFSINPAMLTSAKGRRVIERIPQNRIFLETDGPFVKVGGRSAIPADVAHVAAGLAQIWGVSLIEARKQINSNLWELMDRLQIHRKSTASNR